jgi:hypothetical protein
MTHSHPSSRHREESALAIRVSCRRAVFAPRGQPKSIQKSLPQRSVCQARDMQAPMFQTSRISLPTRNTNSAFIQRLAGSDGPGTSRVGRNVGADPDRRLWRTWLAQSPAPRSSCRPPQCETRGPGRPSGTETLGVRHPPKRAQDPTAIAAIPFSRAGPRRAGTSPGATAKQRSQCWQAETPRRCAALPDIKYRSCGQLATEVTTQLVSGGLCHVENL